MTNTLKLSGMWQDGCFITSIQKFKLSLKPTKQGTAKKDWNRYSLNKSDLLIIDTDFFIPTFHIKKLLAIHAPEDKIKLKFDYQSRTMTLVVDRSITKLKSRQDFKVNAIWKLSLTSDD